MDLIIDQGEIIKNLRPKQKVEVIFTAVEQKGTKSFYSMEGNIVAVISDNLEIELPATYRSWSPLLHLGNGITVNFGRSNALFTFKSKIATKEVLTDFKLFLKLPKVIAKKERRHDRRIPITAFITYKIRGFENTAVMHLQDKIGQGTGQNIALGGMNLLTQLKLPVGLIMEIEFELFNMQVSVLGKVNRVHKNEVNGEQYSIGVKFIKIEEAVAERIAQLISNVDNRFSGGLSV